MSKIRCDYLIHHTSKPPMRIKTRIDDVSHYAEAETAIARLPESAY